MYHTSTNSSEENVLKSTLNLSTKPHSEELLGEYLEDHSWTDICLNPQVNIPMQLWIDRGFGLEPDTHSSSHFTVEQVKQWVFYHLNQQGKSWDAQYPFFDFRHPAGWRVHVLLPPLCATGILVSIRKLHFLNSQNSKISLSALKLLENFQNNHTLSPWKLDPHFQTLRDWVCSGKSGIISGGTGSGKTTLLNTLLSELPAAERVIALEDTPELSSANPGFIALQSRDANAEGKGSVPLRDLLKQTLRMRPDRIILGECRGSEVLELLQLLNTGHAGAIATLHAVSARDALRRLELLCLLATEGRLQIQVIRELIAHGISWIAQIERKTSIPGNCPTAAPAPSSMIAQVGAPTPAPISAKRHIVQMIRIEGIESGTILSSPVSSLPLSPRMSPRISLGM